MTSVNYIIAQKKEDFEKAKVLFIEYSESLGFDLSFQDFREETEDLTKAYSLPAGGIILAEVNNQTVGCVAMKAFDEDICEMKRLYVMAGYRGSGIGRHLAELIIEKAKDAGYKYMRLDTLSNMDAAIGIYRQLSFVEIESYRYNPLENVMYMEKKL